MAQTLFVGCRLASACASMAFGAEYVSLMHWNAAEAAGFDMVLV